MGWVAIISDLLVANWIKSVGDLSYSFFGPLVCIENVNLRDHF